MRLLIEFCCNEKADTKESIARGCKRIADLTDVLREHLPKGMTIRILSEEQIVAEHYGGENPSHAWVTTTHP